MFDSACCFGFRKLFHGASLFVTCTLGVRSYCISWENSNVFRYVFDFIQNSENICVYLTNGIFVTRQS